MSYAQSHPFLRYALIADAAVSGATGLLMIAGAGFLADFLSLPFALLREACLVLIPYVAFVAYVGTRERISRAAVWAVIAANLLWAAGSGLLLLSGWIAPNLLGTLFIIVQAVAVALFGELQFMGLRRAEAVAA
jgi:hypothetical protein